ncbi:MAG: porin [Planctomycetota bacterium]
MGVRVRAAVAIAGCGLGGLAALCAEAQPADPWLDDASREMIQDADGQAALIAEAQQIGNPLAGYDGRFFLASDDGQQRLNLGGYAQIRYYANFNDNDAGTPTDDFESGFQLERVRLIFSGRLREGTTFLLLPFTGSNGRLSILDAWIKQDLGGGFAVQAGQFKLPFFREWLISERFIQPVERSTLSQIYASIYSQGVQATYTEGPLQLALAYSDGLRTLNTPFAGGGSEIEAESGGVTARLQYLPFGDRRDFLDITSLNNREPGLLLGVAAHWQGPTEAFFGTDVNHVFQYTADASYETDGFNLFGAFVGRHIDPAGGGSDENSFGFLAQAGVFVNKNVELVGRYTALLPDSGADGNNTFNEVAIGVNYYALVHALKLTGDLLYFFDDTAGTTVIGFGPSTTTGLLASTGNQAAIRLQLQFIF